MRLQQLTRVAAHRSIATVAAWGLSLTLPNAADWVSSAKYNCSDPLIMRNQSFINEWLQKPKPSTLLKPDTEHIVAEIDQKSVNDGSVTTKSPFITNRVE